jgi:hypothetical protein
MGRRLSTVDLHINVAYFVTRLKNIFSIKMSHSKQGGQLYRAFPFSEASLYQPNLNFQLFEDALDEVAPEKPKKLKSSNKVSTL